MGRLVLTLALALGLSTSVWAAPKVSDAGSIYATHPTTASRSAPTRSRHTQPERPLPKAAPNPGRSNDPSTESSRP